MQRVSGVQDFVRQPVGRLSVGENHLLWCHSPTLVGSVHWGRYGEAATVDLTERLAFAGHPELAGGFDVLMNSQMLESFDWSAWQTLARYVRAQLPSWNLRIRRHAIVHPPGIVGALVGAMLPMMAPRYSFRFFSSLGEAVAWLDRPELAAILDEVDAAVEAARRLSPTLRALREALDRALATANLDDLARMLGHSPRSLQRALREEGTSFTRELTEARLRAARRALEDSDDNIELVARRVGYSSSGLSAIFSRQVGETPAAYRARRR